jgi:hypothetical protein
MKKTFSYIFSHLFLYTSHGQVEIEFFLKHFFIAASRWAMLQNLAECLLFFLIIIIIWSNFGLFIRLFFISRVEKDIYYHLRQHHAGHRLGPHHRIYSSLVVEFLVHKNRNTHKNTLRFPLKNIQRDNKNQLYLNIYEKGRDNILMMCVNAQRPTGIDENRLRCLPLFFFRKFT